MVLEYSSCAPQKKADDYDADECARRRTRDKPHIKLQQDDQDEHGNNCDATTAKNEKGENAGNASDDNAEHDRNCRDERRVLEVLLRSKITIKKAARARSMVKEVLNPREQPGEQINSCIRDRSVARMLRTFIGIIVE